jgi:hypothetical protein
MQLLYASLLQIQLEIQKLPRSPERFRQYLDTITVDGETLRYPPLGLMNPMGKEHITTLLEEYLTLNVDTIATNAMSAASEAVNEIPGSYNLGLVVIDDLMGGWTNRYDYEFNLRFCSPRSEPRPRWLHEDWLCCPLWSSQPAAESAIRDVIATTIHRAAYQYHHGQPTTLRQMIQQEGQVYRRAHCSGPTLDSDDLEYTREVIAPHLEASDKRTCMECLFGDEVARTLGFTPRGLSPWAGLALACHNATTDSL